MSNLEQQWRELDARIRAWWDGDLKTATEKDVCGDEHGTLLFLPFPYSSGGGSEAAFPEMYGWDTFFINLGMLAHGRKDLVRNHILNQLFMIERYGMVLNGNRTFFLTRSQPPLLAESVYRYCSYERDLDLLAMAYPLLKREYEGYWCADHHHTPIGLSTNRDLGDPAIRPELAAEAETGLDFDACFDGDIRRCAPLITNCVLVKYTCVMAWIARELGWNDQSELWDGESEHRAELIRRYCWNDDKGFFFEYDFVNERQIPVWSLCGYWALWAGVATREQPARAIENLDRFEKDHGLTFTSEEYPSPHPEFEWLQWGYPSGWPPMHIVAVEAFDAAGFPEHARRVAGKYVALVMKIYNETGKLWEKYNVVDGDLQFGHERYDVPPMHGWASAAAAVLGRRAFSK